MLFHKTAVAVSHSLRPNFTVLFLFGTNDGWAADRRGRDGWYVPVENFT